MEDATNLDGVRIGANKEEPVVADAQPEFLSSPESFYIALAGFGEAMQGGKNVWTEPAKADVRRVDKPAAMQTIRFNWVL